MSDDPIDRDKLDAWTAPEPPPGFADRVMAARQRPAHVARPRRRPLLVGGAIAIAAAAAVLFVLLRAPSRGTVSGTVATSTERQTVKLAARGVAVVEPASRISYRVLGDGSTTVEQDRGDVFYRVDRGGSFEVATPAGEVRVTGTCFRVEVFEMPVTKQGVVGAAVGAAVASAVFVTVYEGRVLLASKKGEPPAAVSAGERASMGPDGIRVEKGGAAVAALEPPAPPSASATREELLERDRLQREELAQLRFKVRELEAQAAEGPKVGFKRRRGGPGGPHDAPFVDPTPEDLLDMARNCQVQSDSPPLDSNREITPKMAAEIGLTEDERVKINEAMKQFKADIASRLRELYVEVTGDPASAEMLALDALWREIQDKSDEKDLEEAMWRISQERAGLLAPPADLASRPAVERGARLMTSLGDEFEKVLAKILGAERAHEIRKKDDGFPQRSVMTGCPPDKPSLAPPAP